MMPRKPALSARELEAERVFGLELAADVLKNAALYRSAGLVAPDFYALWVAPVPPLKSFPPPNKDDGGLPEPRGPRVRGSGGASGVAGEKKDGGGGSQAGAAPGREAR